MNEEREKLKSKSREVPLFVSPKWRKRERKRERESERERRRVHPDYTCTENTWMSERLSGFLVLQICGSLFFRGQNIWSLPAFLDSFSCQYSFSFSFSFSLPFSQFVITSNSSRQAYILQIWIEFQFLNWIEKHYNNFSWVYVF